MRALVWFRADLRVSDNPALVAACERAEDGVVAVFLVSAAQWRRHDWGANRADFTLRSLAALAPELHSLGIPLRVVQCPRFADAPAKLLEVARANGCHALFFNREYELNEARRDRAVEQAFQAAGLGVTAEHDQCVVVPGRLQTQTGQWYTVYSPFRKAWGRLVSEQDLARPLPRPRPKRALADAPDAVPVECEGFSPNAAVSAHWPAGETAALAALERFASRALDAYADRRDLPSVDGTSQLSPHLAVGSISARTCVRAAMTHAPGSLDSARGSGASTWISELAWRDFYRHILVGFPRVCMHRAFKPDTENVPWRNDAGDYAAWCEGRTGIPIVDAGMRQLLETGWMHNRVRMIVAMFFAKHLLLDWRLGERHFAQHLVDLDLGSNNGGWQWAASTGTDAAPYFRIFNPWIQGQRFDPDGVYTHKYVPELRAVSGSRLHDPNILTPLLRRSLGYPGPIVEHEVGRDRALRAFKTGEL
jgi:deoxyribodipyrimidine photo-lyase